MVGSLRCLLMVVLVVSGCSIDRTAGGGLDVLPPGTATAEDGGVDGAAPGDDSAPDGLDPGDDLDVDDVDVDDASDAAEDDGSAEGCGDGLLSAGEACDDGNRAAGDGCTASCQLEPGYACPVVGARCRAAACGDGMIAADEECEDGGAVAGDGCDARCRLEPGHVCAQVGKPCQVTMCGDSVVQGSEQCDDGLNDRPYDGCFRCRKETSCDQSGCAALCGDGIKFPGEACDDGNSRSGDGCSSTCSLEQGFTCTATAQDPPAFVDLPIVYRDLRGDDLGDVKESGIEQGHPDFEKELGPEKGLVGPLLGADKKPVYAKEDGKSTTTESAAMFAKWYRHDPAYNRTVVDYVRLTRNEMRDYVFEDRSFFPLDTRGFVAEGHEPLRLGALDEQGKSLHNFSFTSELRTQFEYKGSEFLEFFGDDDVWVFVNGHLAVDLGGVHGSETGSVTLDQSKAAAFGLVVGNIYEIVVFQAERHTSSSQYKLTLRDFVRTSSSCQSICGDGVLTADEACDDGVNDGGYGQCATGCVFGPRCGDGVVQGADGEQCDDTNRNDADACSNLCKRTSNM